MSGQESAALIDALPLPAVLIGPEERIEHANEAAQGLIGPGIVGRHFITALRQPAILDAVESCLAQGQTRRTRFLSREGDQDTSFDVTCAAVETGSGRGALVCFEDVTSREQADQMRRDFVANVSHELRSPLTALLGFIETLRGPAREDARARQRFLETMQVEAQRMERLVHDLLSLSRVEAQARVRPTDPVDLGRLARSVTETLRVLAEEHHVRLVVEAPPSPVIVPGDGDQLRQVITNLVENAINYGGRGKTVTVAIATREKEAALRGPAAVISVGDEGPGIDPVHLPRLTERFYRVDNHRSRAMGGTGLGLAIVKHVVGRHRGRLRIESTPGEGSVFRVLLPMTGGR